jgi:hypothetical protein
VHTATAELKIVDGIIRTRGEFYAERRFVPYYANKVKLGHYNYRERDIRNTMWCICTVTEEERAAFPELERVATVGIQYEGKKCQSWVRSWSYQKR